MERDPRRAASLDSRPPQGGPGAEALDRRAFVQRTLAGAGAVAMLAGLPEVRRADAQTTTKREAVIAQGGDISRFDPHYSTAANDVRLTFNLYDNLISRRVDGSLQPGLATEWKTTSPTTYQLKLRPGVRWHNGDPFTSADVKFSLERTYNPAMKTLVATSFNTVERIETPDAVTVVLHTHKPDPLLPSRLAIYGGQIVPKKYLESAGNDAFNARPVGTGPLRFVSWTKDDRAVFDANPDYWGGRMDVDRVIYRPISETAARMGALLKGEVDLVSQVPADQLERINRNPTTRTAAALFSGLYVLAVNSRVPPLNNPLVKQALSLAIDREAIVKELWRGRAIVANGPIARGDNHHDASLPPLPYNPAEARERLKKAGYRNEPIVIETTVGYTANDKVMAEAIASMWKDAGVNAQIEVIEYSVRAQKNRDRSFKGLWWSDPTSTLGDPDGMMWRLLAPGGIQDYWRHPEFDELGAQARVTLDEKARGEAYRKMTRIFLEHNPWIVILQPYEDYGMQKYVDFTPHPLQLFELRRFNFRMRRA